MRDVCVLCYNSHTLWFTRRLTSCRLLLIVIQQLIHKSSDIISVYYNRRQWAVLLTSNNRHVTSPLTQIYIISLSCMQKITKNYTQTPEESNRCVILYIKKLTYTRNVWSRSRQFGTSAEVSERHFGTGAELSVHTTRRLHVAWVCTRAARKENTNPNHNPNTHGHCCTEQVEMSYVCAYSSVQLDISRVEKEFTKIIRWSESTCNQSGGK